MPAPKAMFYRELARVLSNNKKNVNHRSAGGRVEQMDA
jgi:hypothetical protein